jgi:hypothetical protein
MSDALKAAEEILTALETERHKLRDQLHFSMLRCEVLQRENVALKAEVERLRAVDCESLGQHQVCDHVLDQIQEAKEREARLALRVRDLHARLEALGEAP